MRDSRHLVALDGLRGLAALCVLLLHLVLYFDLGGKASIIANHAYLAVDCFYMISGFVIAYAFDRKMERGLSTARFFLSRVVRLYPMLLVGAILGAATLAGFRHAHPEIPVASMLTAGTLGLVLVPSYALIEFKPYVFPLNSSFWSLSLEFLLYALYALAFAPLQRRLVLTCTLLASAGTLAWVSFAAGSLDVGYRAGDYPFGFARGAFPFLAGMAIRRSGLYRPDSLRLGSLAILLVLPLLCNPLAKGGAYDATTVLVAYPLIIVAAVNSRRLPGLDGVSSWIGDLSYPLYAIHYPIVVACGNACRIVEMSAAARLLTALGCAAATIAAAALLSKFFDRPVRAALAGRLAAVKDRSLRRGSISVTRSP